MKRVAVVAGLFGLLEAGAPGPSVEVSPLFWHEQDRPAFAIRCTNTSAAARQTVDYVLKSQALRLDGKLIERKGVAASLVKAEVAKGEQFVFVHLLGGERGRESLPLAQMYGAYVETSWNLLLTPGQHRISFRCWEDWSDELDFAWASL